MMLINYIVYIIYNVIYFTIYYFRTLGIDKKITFMI